MQVLVMVESKVIWTIGCFESFVGVLMLEWQMACLGMRKLCEVDQAVLVSVRCCTVGTGECPESICLWAVLQSISLWIRSAERKGPRKKKNTKPEALNPKHWVLPSPPSNSLC